VAVFFAEILHTDISINQEKHTFYNYYTNWMLLWHHSLIVCLSLLMAIGAIGFAKISENTLILFLYFYFEFP